MLLKLYQVGQPILRKKARSVSPKVLATKRTQAVIDFMIDTLRDAPGVGLAAPQVGVNMRIIIIDDKAKYHEQVPKGVLKAQGRKPVPLKVIVNPEVEIKGDNSELWFEGCLSVDGYAAAVPRAYQVKVKGLDRKGRDLAYTAKGWHARILQHELDHLNGALYIDKMKPKSFMNIKNFNLNWRKALQTDIKKAFGG